MIYITWHTKVLWISSIDASTKNSRDLFPTELKFMCSSTTTLKHHVKTFFFNSAYTPQSPLTVECAIRLVIGGTLQMLPLLLLLLLMRPFYLATLLANPDKHRKWPLMVCPVWGRGTSCPFTSSSFPPFTFPFLSLALPIFFFCQSLPFLPE